MKLKILFDEEGNAVGRYDKYGNLYTMTGRPSLPYLPGPRINKSHRVRETIYERDTGRGTEQGNE